jgi:hypothetical protein
MAPDFLLDPIIVRRDIGKVIEPGVSQFDLIDLYTYFEMAFAHHFVTRRIKPSKCLETMSKYPRNLNHAMLYTLHLELTRKSISFTSRRDRENRSVFVRDRVDELL